MFVVIMAEYNLAINDYVKLMTAVKGRAAFPSQNKEKIRLSFDTFHLFDLCCLWKQDVSCEILF